MKIKSIIIDDEKHGRENLAGILRQYCLNVDLLGYADSVDAAFFFGLAANYEKSNMCVFGAIRTTLFAVSLLKTKALTKTFVSTINRISYFSRPKVRFISSISISRSSANFSGVSPLHGILSGFVHYFKKLVNRI